MLSNNAKKLLTADLSTPSADNLFWGVFTAVDGQFVTHNNTSTNAIMNSRETTEAIAKQRCACTLSIAIFGYRGMGSVEIAKKSTLPSDVWPASSKMYIVPAYDQEDAPITPDAFNVPGNDLSDSLQSCSVTSQNKYVTTITFNNASNSVMHVNRIGIYMPMQKFPTSSSGNGSLLLYIFAFDDIALAPGETKSITIQPDLD